MVRTLFTALCALLFTAAHPLMAAPERGGGLARVIDSEARQTGFSGTILVTQNGRILYRRSHGLADRSFAIRATNTNRYRIASITKLFTSTLVMRLAEEGRLDLGAPIGKYIPDYPGEGADRITIAQLLNHTSGIAQFDRVESLEQALREGIPQYQRPLTAPSLLALCCGGRLAHVPGAVFDYNNADYILLGRIIERVTGKSYADVLSERILKPLALNDTGIAFQAAIIPRLTPTYYWRGARDGWMNDLPVYYENWDAAGSMYSTATDLARFSDALYGGRLIRRASLEAMLRPGKDEYGFGLWSYAFKAGGRTWRVAKRPGSIMGANTQLYRLLDRQANVIILGNTNRADLDEMAQRVGTWLATH
ncbi:MAG TPA: serine hydrolase domain-containing protein [Sphingomicrobium sp.]